MADAAVALRIVELQQAAYSVEAALIGFDGIPPLHDTVEDVLGHDLMWIGAYDGEVLVGGLGYVDGTDCRDIDRLFVDPAYARRGIGRALVSSVLDAPEIKVSTGTANHPAIRLYRSLGFVPDSPREIAAGVTVTQLLLRP